MNYKPDESTLLSYLYGELSDKEAEKLEAYFKLHPEELSKLQGFGDVREIMSHAQDKEVIAPPIFFDNDGTRSLWKSSYFKVSLSIAASILFLLIAGKLLGPDISYSNGELRISFGRKMEQPATPAGTLTEEKVNELISSSLAKNNETIAATREEDQKRIVQTLADFSSKKMDALTKVASQASEEQVRSFVSSMQEQNLKLMKDYFQLSAADQKKYMESLLTDFSGYLQEQRKQDLQYVQTRVNSIEKTNNQ